MDIELIGVSKTEQPLTFEIFKSSMQPVIEAAFGWDEAFQQHYFASRLQPAWFYWAVFQGERVGLVCYKHTEQSVHLHLLAVFESWRGQGLGVTITNQLQQEARRAGKPLTLSCFKNNAPAVALYHKLGFAVASEDEHFFDFIHDPNS
ncbi:GNAT family N-acetyltransferase [Photobacterium sp. MCCC 1A19761]|uniref:GNAT family N-acetyltransferase n=1 Tax=Photobacterium sp. MCCC 1A19761 TaxID=3115000 RepID=UPI00307DE11D